MAGAAGQQAATRPARRGASRDPGPVAAVLPVARVAVDIPLAHLDRPFDYLVPGRLSDQAVPGCRVRVRFAGQLVDGYLLDRAEASEHQGRLARLERVVSPEPVLSPEIMALAREVADRWAGTLADVLRLAIPPRHARTESAAPLPGPGGPGPGRPAPGPWARYPDGPAFLDALASRRGPRAVWSALPGPHWPEEIARAVATAAAAGRGALAVVPDARDLSLLDEALTAQLGPGRHVTLSADLGPAERYRRWLAVRRGAQRVVAGTRAAMFAPVSDLGLVVLWDDGDDLHAEPRAPYPHAREVLALRAHRTGAAVLIGGFARTAESTSLVASGWARPIVAGRPVLRDHAPAVRAAGGDTELARDEAAQTARLPSLVLRTAREGLASGPVLVQVPRRGYVAALGCARCRERARCAACGGPLALASVGAAPRCGWCGAADERWRCSRCGHSAVRALVTGAGRTAEELSRAFPGVPLITSGGAAMIPARARLARAGRGHAGSRAAGRRRVRGRVAAGRLDAARPAQPARRRGGPAPLDERGRAGPRRARGRPGGRGGRLRHPRGAGADPVGSGHPLRAGTRRAGRASFPARGHA